jgi:hypothetical protein
MFWQSLQVTFEIFCSDVAQSGSCFFSGSNTPNKLTFCKYIDGINRTKGPFVMFMGHYWSANKRSLSKVRHELYFISVLCGACRVEICYALFVYCCHQIIASYAFAEKPF